MKWLRFFLLLVVVVAFGCSSAPSNTQGDVEDADATEVDAAQEAAAGGTATEEPSGEAQP